MTVMNIEAGKEYTARDGSRVRIYATDADEPLPIHGAILNLDRGWLIQNWHKNGYVGSAPVGPIDIISEVPETIEIDCWVMVYPDGSLYPINTPWDEARGDAIPTPHIAQFHIKRSILPGEGM
jgi:hypothetical protein